MNRIEIVKLGQRDYQEVLKLQEKLMGEVQSSERDDTLLIVEHYPVLTLGRSGKSNNIIAPKDILDQEDVKIYEVSRGGDVTYHGPGQIVGYPIMDLRKHGRDIKDFMWKLEEVFMQLLKEEFDIVSHREEKKFTGVWVGEDKITAMGIAVKRWVTMHGFAFNVNTNLEHFEWIIPCGLTGRGVTSLEKITGMKQNMDRLNNLVIDYFCRVFKLKHKTLNPELLL